MPAFGDEYIVRFDVAMDDSLGVRRVQRVGDLNRQARNGFQFERASADGLLQGLAIEQFHRQVNVAAVFADIVNGADIRMIQGRRRLRFSSKSFEGLRIFG